MLGAARSGESREGPGEGRATYPNPQPVLKFPTQAELVSLQKKVTAERKLWKEVEAPARKESKTGHGSNYVPGAIQAAAPQPGLPSSRKRAAEGRQESDA